MSPKAVIVISGKRKSGKDFIGDLLLNRLGPEKCTILRLSGPLKKQYAKEHNLEFERLLDASEYKEIYRADMIKWGEDKRNQDPGFFCRLATSGEDLNKDVWIISDARRLTDIAYFKNEYSKATITVRVESDLAVRQQRGFIFVDGVDNAESECGLDSYGDWDVVITNNGDNEQLENSISQLLKQLI